jgi:hypothetical protein
VLYLVFYYVLDIKMNIHKCSLENPVNGVIWDFPSSREIEAQLEEAEKNA